MPSVLITRPAQMSAVLAETLNNLGYETVCEPLLSIAPLNTQQPQSDKPDAIAITSANALLALRERQSSIAELLDVPCFCVGPRTADSARKFGFRRVQNSAAEATELAKLIAQTIDKKNAAILHIAGRDITGTLRAELERQDYRLVDWPVYEAIPVTTLTQITHDLLTDGMLDAAVVFSPRTASVLTGLITDHALETCCASLTAICLSEAVADGLRPLKWRRLLAAPQPTEDALIACLQETCPVKS